MSSELTVHAVHQGAMRISATANAHAHTVQMDYPPKLEDAAGFTPLQLLLASLAGCASNSLVALLRRMSQPVQGLECTVRGLRRDEHPTVFTEIAMDFVVRGAGVDPAAVARALEQSEAKICPVWAMLKGGPTITARARVEA